jgi:ferric-dicitrate binding protein FerR (iron transport regulator)
MPNAEEIANWKTHYADYSDEQLIAAKHQWVESSEMHIAAVQILHERQQLAQQKALDLAHQYHLETLSQERLLHRKTQFVAWLAAIASVAGILFQIFYPATSTNLTQSTQSAPPTPVALPSPSSSYVPQATTPQSAKQPTKHPSP